MENIIFTVRPNPRTGESLWSYLLRLANQNGVPFLSMLNSIKQWDRKYVQRADLHLLDISYGSVLNMEQLTNLTGQSMERLQNVTLAPLLRKFGVNQEIQRARSVSGMILDTYRYCPQCLKEMLYYRLLWKLAPVTACTLHDVYLVNGCPSCKKQVHFRDVELLDVCPYCGFSLLRSQAQSIDDSDREEQHWTNKALLVLFEPGHCHVKSDETAMRLLYLHCGRQPYFDRQLLEAAVLSVLPTLLQHARDSLSQRRTLHLSFLLKTLYEHHHSMNEFLELTVPDSFVESVRQSLVRKADQLSCLAPWCNGFQQPGTLVKTGTTMKKRKSGEILLYYLACTECGCEYAIGEDGELQERTYFIEAYQALRKEYVPLTGIKLLARSIGFTEDKTRRCLAYFCTRIKSSEWNVAGIEIDTSLLEQVLNKVRKGILLQVIQHWACWESYQQFLVYRFHPEVMRALVNLKRSQPLKRSDGIVNCEKIHETLEGLLERDEDITIDAVCNLLGVCPETIRNRRYNELIAEAKQLQRGQRFQSRKDKIYEKMETYLLSNPTAVVTSRAVYGMLGIQRTVLWRTAPELTAYIHEQIVRHNRSVKDVVELIGADPE